MTKPATWREKDFECVLNNSLLEYAKILTFSKLAFASLRISNVDFAEIDIFYTYKILETLKNMKQRIQKILHHYSFYSDINSIDRETYKKKFLEMFENQPDILIEVKKILETNEAESSESTFDRSRLVTELQELRLQNLELEETKRKVFDEVKRSRSDFINAFHN